jgi:hypothetical protein
MIDPVLLFSKDSLAMLVLSHGRFDSSTALLTVWAGLTQSGLPEPAAVAPLGVTILLEEARRELHAPDLPLAGLRRHWDRRSGQRVVEPDPDRDV